MSKIRSTFGTSCWPLPMKTRLRRRTTSSRFKFHGLFYVAPAQDSFMVRLRISGAVLTTHQMRGLAKLARECGPGRVDITTRANLQIRELQPKDIVRVLTSIQAIGLSSRGSGADNSATSLRRPLPG